MSGALAPGATRRTRLVGRDRDQDLSRTRLSRRARRTSCVRRRVVPRLVLLTSKWVEGMV